MVKQGRSLWGRAWAGVLAVILTGLFLASSGAGARLRAAEEAEEREPLLLFNTASRFYRQENWRDAAASFGEFLGKFPRHRDAPEARFAAGYSLHKVGDHAAAVELLRLAARDDGAAWAADASFYLGRSLDALAAAAKDAAERRGRLEAAAESYARAAVFHGKLVTAPAPGAKEESAAARAEREKKHLDLRVLALSSQGESLRAAGKEAEAARALEPLLAERERLGTSTHYQRGLYVLGLARQALAAPGNPGAPASRPAAGARRYAAAREPLAIAADARYAKEALWEKAAFLLARLAHEDGDLAAAVTGYEAVASRRGPLAADAAYHGALARYETGRPEEVKKARADFARFLDAHADHALALKARFYEAVCAFEGKDYAAAEAAFAGVAADSKEFAGRALLRRGQALFLKDPPDAVAAAATLSQAFDLLSAEAVPGAEPAARSRVSEALYWRGEALAAQGGESLAAAAEVFGDVHARFAGEAPERAEEALYRKARSLHLAGKRLECAVAADGYRKAYPEGRYLAESLLLSAESAFHAEPGGIPEALRRDAPRLYRQAAAGLKDPAESRRARYMTGVSEYFLKEYGAAAASLEELLQEAAAKTEFPEGLYYLADALALDGEGDAAAARSRLERAVPRYREYLETAKSGANLPNALANLGLCEERLLDHEAARKTFERFLAAYPEHPLASQVRFEIGNARLSLGDLEGAAAAYAAAAGGRAPASDPLLPARALLQAGLIERRLGKPARAAETLRSLLGAHGAALGAAPAGATLRADAEFHRAAALLEAGQAEDARRELAAFLERNPGSSHEPEARHQLARSLLDAGDAAGALAVIAPLAAGDESRPGRDQALYLKAWCHAALAAKADAAEGPGGAAAATPEGTRQREEMEDAYRKLIAEHPGSPPASDAALELGQHLFNRKAYAEARKRLESAREASEARLQAGGAAGVRAAEVLEKSIFGLAFISFHEERLDESAQLFDRVAANASSPVAGRAAFQAGRALMKLDRPQDAAARFEKAAGDLRESAGDLHEESLLRLGECYQKLGKHADAVRVLDRELAEYPEGALRHEARFARGYALQLEGQRGPAVEAYRAVVIGTRAPVAARAQYHIGECLLDDGKNRDAAREFAAVVANFDFAGEYAEWVRRALLAAGLAYQAAGDAAAANAQFKELSERFPQTEEGKVAAARLRDAAAGN